MQFIDQCPICTGKTFTHFLTCWDYTVSHETFSLIRCETCSQVITSPRPADKDLGRYYLSDNYISHAKKSKNVFDKVYQISRLYTLRWKLQLIKSHLDSETKYPSLLDFGCGTGEFLLTCKKSGFNIKGTEPSATARSNVSSLIKADVYESLEIFSGDFDVITLWHVLEHVPDLNYTLSRLNQRLKKNGTMFIAVPNHQSKDGSIYQNDWAGYDVPRHLWHFTQQSMKQLLINHKLILKEVVPMKLDALYVSMLSEKNKKNSLGVVSMAKGLINGLKSNLEANSTNQYSSLIYIVQK